MWYNDDDVDDFMPFYASLQCKWRRIFIADMIFFVHILIKKKILVWLLSLNEENGKEMQIQWTKLNV